MSEPDLSRAGLDKLENLAEVSSLRKEILAVIARVREQMRALESLTVGGSEFVGDVQACVAYVQKKVSTLHEIAKNATLRAQRAEQSRDDFARRCMERAIAADYDTVDFNEILDAVKESLARERAKERK